MFYFKVVSVVGVFGDFELRVRELIVSVDARRIRVIWCCVWIYGCCDDDFYVFGCKFICFLFNLKCIFEFIVDVKFGLIFYFSFVYESFVLNVRILIDVFDEIV